MEPNPVKAVIDKSSIDRVLHTLIYGDDEKVGKSGIEIAKEELQTDNEDYAGYVLWNETGFPQFWNIPEDGKTPEECLRKQLRDYLDGTKDEP